MNQTGKIACVGMTHLGLVHAVAFAEKGFDLVCYDPDLRNIESLQQGFLPVEEPDLKALMERNSQRIEFSADLASLSECGLVFIACDVPTDDQGNSDLSIIHDLIALVAPALSADAALVILSQVPPGFTRGLDFPKSRLFYQVETLIFGSAVQRALFPERYIVGLSDAGKDLPRLYEQLLNSFSCPILKMRYESAELAKITINLFLVSSVTTTNTVAEICESIGADWSDIAAALRLDKRIGQHAYLKPGLGIAGGNLERDLNTLIRLGQRYATHTQTVEAWLDNSRYRRDWVSRLLKEHGLAEQGVATLCVLGLSYKPNTHSVKNSPSLALLKTLNGHSITAHDPIVKLSEPGVRQVESVEEAVKGADVLIIMTPWSDYQSLSLAWLKEHFKGRVIIDPYQALPDHLALSDHFTYFRLGAAPTLNKNESCAYA